MYQVPSYSISTPQPQLYMSQPQVYNSQPQVYNSQPQPYVIPVSLDIPEAVPVEK